LDLRAVIEHLSMFGRMLKNMRHAATIYGVMICLASGLAS